MYQPYLQQIQSMQPVLQQTQNLQGSYVPNSGIPSSIKAHLRQGGTNLSGKAANTQQQQAYQPQGGATFFQNNQGVNSYSQLPAIGPNQSAGASNSMGNASGHLNGAGFASKSGQDLSKEMM